VSGYFGVFNGVFDGELDTTVPVFFSEGASVIGTSVFYFSYFGGCTGVSDATVGTGTATGFS
jgi:hypothetical protein